MKGSLVSSIKTYWEKLWGLILVEKKSGKRIDLSKVLKMVNIRNWLCRVKSNYLIDRATGKTPEDIKVTRSEMILFLKVKKRM
ncbi:hypothetical protein INT80_13660 [Gallibacterium anatis]|uniref:Uncharacterized protein n=1 Tax=Gallibacterium anatis TaxID=750 RepID=A0A930UXJ5_9PAST|nr:hypothetical protein [Gallibacterium anatis]